MRRTRLALLLAIALGAAALLSSCATPRRPVFPLGPRIPPPYLVWRYPGGQAPPMTITFIPDGAVKFDGGFANYKTANWDYDSAIEDLTVTIPEYENPEKTLHIQMGSGTESFEFLGWVFFRAPAEPVKH